MHGGLGSSHQHLGKTEHDSHFARTVLGNGATDQNGQWSYALATENGKKEAGNEQGRE